jgi:hypothetical protein
VVTDGTEPTPVTGLLVIRVWLESDSTEPLRAQVRLTNDVSVGSQRAVTLTQIDPVCATVRQWLEDMGGRAGQPT